MYFSLGFSLFWEYNESVYWICQDVIEAIGSLIDFEYLKFKYIMQGCPLEKCGLF